MSIRREDRPTYASAIWETFRQKFQPGRLSLTSAEFHQISTWMDRNIPLAVILEGLEGMGGHPRTLMGCYAAVEEEIARWERSYSV